jgi:hypothetical protein
MSGAVVGGGKRRGGDAGAVVGAPARTDAAARARPQVHP